MVLLVGRWTLRSRLPNGALCMRRAQGGASAVMRADAPFSTKSTVAVVTRRRMRDGSSRSTARLGTRAVRCILRQYCSRPRRHRALRTAHGRGLPN